MSTPLGKRAVGIDGSATARALTDRVAQVIVFERDSLPTDAAPRTGARHSWQRKPRSVYHDAELIRKVTAEFGSLTDARWP